MKPAIYYKELLTCCYGYNGEPPNCTGTKNHSLYVYTALVHNFGATLKLNDFRSTHLYCIAMNKYWPLANLALFCE